MLRLAYSSPGLSVEVIYCVNVRCGILTPAPVAMDLNHPYTIFILRSLSAASFGDLDMVANLQWSQMPISGLVRGRTLL